MRYAIFIDIESNGLDPSLHRSLEIALQIVDLQTGHVKAAYSSLIKQDEAAWAKSDQISLSVNGFTWEQVQEGKPEQQVSQEIITLFQEHAIDRTIAFFLAQNPSFDRAFFSQLISISDQDRYRWPYHWLDFASMYWGLRIHELKHKRLIAQETSDSVNSSICLSKDAIAASFGLPPEQKPHRAMRGVEHLIQCYAHVVGWGTG